MNSLSSAGVPTSIKNLKVLIVLLIGVMFMTLTFWSATAPLDSAALASGQIAVEGNRKTIQHLEGGIISRILVSEGQIVKAGDPLILMDTTQIESQQKSLQSRKDYLMVYQHRLKAERDRQERLIYSQEWIQKNRHIESLIQNEIVLFNDRRSTLQTERQIITKQIDVLSSENIGLQGKIISNQSLIYSISEELEIKRSLLLNGHIDAIQLKQLDRHIFSLKGELKEFESSLEGNLQRIQELELKHKQLTQNHQREVSTELAGINQQLFEVQQELIILQDQYQRTHIRAPVDGAILGLTVHNIGAVINPGDPILDIVPQHEPLIVHAKVQPQDIDRVHNGLLAKIRFTSFNNNLTPEVYGKVFDLSADSLIDQQSQLPYYLAKIQITQDAIESLGDQLLIPGMPAEVLINTGSRTLLAYLAQPIADSVARSLIED